MSVLTYAGIGSRTTPVEVLGFMTALARRLELVGWTLRSGHAAGADQAFEAGAGQAAELFLPWPEFEGGRPPLVRECHTRPTVKARELASTLHPAWHNLTEGGKKLHARNCHQVLGINLDDPVEFVCCWTPGGNITGGTATAIKLAYKRNVTVINLARPGEAGNLKPYLDEHWVLKYRETP